MSSPPPILSYDQPSTTVTPSKRMPFFAYCLGLALPLVPYALLGLFVDLRVSRDDLSQAAALPRILLLLWLIDCFLAAILLIPTMRIRTKILRNVAYAPFRKCLLVGLLPNLLPLLLYNALPIPSAAKTYVGLAILAWHILIPILAAVFLCERSHHREP